MSVTINIIQNKKETKKIDLNSLQTLIEKEELTFKVPNEALALEPYEGKKDIREQLLIIYQPNMIGRGFSFLLNHEYNIEMRLNYPSTKKDITCFYQFLKNICTSFKWQEFIQEEQKYNLEQIDELQDECLFFNQNVIKTSLKENLTIFGAIYPITLEKKLIKAIKKLDAYHATNYFQDYLNQKQQEDYYYAKPMIYQNENEFYAAYTLTESVATIFPLKPYIPASYSLTKDYKIKSWLINIVQYQDAKYNVFKVIPFEELSSIIKIKRCKKFDATHIIIKLSKKEIEKIR